MWYIYLDKKTSHPPYIVFFCVDEYNLLRDNSLTLSGDCDDLSSRFEAHYLFIRSGLNLQK